MNSGFVGEIRRGVPHRGFPEGLQGNHEIPQSKLTSGPRFETGIS